MLRGTSTLATGVACACPVRVVESLKWLMSPTMRPIGWRSRRPATPCCSTNALASSALRLNSPGERVEDGLGPMLDVGVSISTVWNIATAIIRRIGAITSVGLWITVASTPKAMVEKQQDDEQADAHRDPAAGESGAPSVMSGMANHAIVGTCGPPLRATLQAMITCEAAQLASSAVSGCLARSIRVSATRKVTMASASGRRVTSPAAGRGRSGRSRAR